MMSSDIDRLQLLEARPLTLLDRFSVGFSFIVVGFVRLCFGLVVVVDTHDCAGKGEYFSEGSEYGGMYLSGGWRDEGGYNHEAAEDSHCDGENELDAHGAR